MKHPEDTLRKPVKLMKNTPELPIMSFETPAQWEAWLDEHHSSSAGVWMKFAKKYSGLTTITYKEALDLALCYGWIDSQLSSFDEKAYLQRFTPRGAKSVWSKKNTEHVERLIREGRMQPAGLMHIESAKMDGRWDVAYPSPKNVTMPDDFKEALAKNAKAAAFYQTLNKANTYGILTRIQFAKRADTRAKRIQEFIEMLERGEKLH